MYIGVWDFGYGARPCSEFLTADAGPSLWDWAESTCPAGKSLRRLITALSVSLLLRHTLERCQRLHLVDPKSNPPSVKTRSQRSSWSGPHRLTPGPFHFQHNEPHRARLTRKRSRGQQISHHVEGACFHVGHWEVLRPLETEQIFSWQEFECISVIGLEETVWHSGKSSLLKVKFKAKVCAEKGFFHILCIDA